MRKAIEKPRTSFSTWEIREEQRDGRQHRRQQHEQQRDPVDADVVGDPELRDPRDLLAELEAELEDVEARPERERQHELEDRDADREGARGADGRAREQQQEQRPRRRQEDEDGQQVVAPAGVSIRSPPRRRAGARDQAEEERQGVIADVARLEEAQEVARELDEEGAGVQDPVDDQDVDDLPQRAREPAEGPHEEEVVELVDPELVGHEGVARRAWRRRCGPARGRPASRTTGRPGTARTPRRPPRPPSGSTRSRGGGPRGPPRGRRWAR